MPFSIISGWDALSLDSIRTASSSEEPDLIIINHIHHLLLASYFLIRTGSPATPCISHMYYSSSCYPPIMVIGEWD